MKKTAILKITAIILALFIAISGCSKEEPKYQITQPAMQASQQDTQTSISIETPVQSTYQKITLLTEDQLEIKANYYPQSKKSPSVILLHQLGRDKSTYNSLSKKLFNAGFNVVALDLRGHGENTGKSFTEFTNEDFKQMTKDVQTAYDMLAASDNADSDDISLVGASIGANTALVFANIEPIKKVVLLSPGIEYRGINIDMAIQEYGLRPVMIVASEDDRYAFESSSELDKKAKGEHLLITMEGSKHGTDMFKGTTLEEDIVSWLKK